MTTERSREAASRQTGGIARENDLTTDELLAVLADCAGRAERLRQRGAEVVLLTGSELILFTIGLLPGATLSERLDLLTAPEHVRELMPEVRSRINDFLGNAVDVVRGRFGGKISYASLPFEGVDWTPFDFISTDAGYRSIEVADRYCDDIRTLVVRATPKPVAITEFGCTTHQGAAHLDGRGNTMVEWDHDGKPIRLKGAYTRDEGEQARYLSELLDIFHAGLSLRNVDPATSRTPEERQQTLAHGTQEWARDVTTTDVPVDSLFVLCGISLTGRDRSG